MTSAVLCAMLGLLVMVGWHVHSVVLIQLRSSLAPMPYNTALGFLLGGVGLMAALSDRRYVTLACGGVVAVLGLLTLAQYVFGVDLGVDELLMQGDVIGETSHSGRMALSTTVAFALIGVALLSAVRRQGGPGEWLIVVLLGVAVAGLGFVELSSYGVGAAAPFGWGRFTRMAIPTAVVLLVLGSGLIATGDRRRPREESGLGFLVPSLGVGLALLAVTLSSSLAEKARVAVELAVEQRANLARVMIESLVEGRVLALRRMGHRLETSGAEYHEQTWEADAALYIAHQPGLQAVQWVDPSLQVRWIVPHEADESRRGVDIASNAHRRRALEAARDRRKTTVSHVSDVARGGKSFVISDPLFVGDVLQGWIVGVVRAQEFFEPIASVAGSQGYDLAVLDGDAEMFRSAAPRPGLEAQWAHETSANVSGLQWRVRTWPREELLAQHESLLPWLVLAASISIALLLVLVAYLTRVTRRNLLEIQKAEREAARQIAEREHMERRFELVVDATPNGVLLVDERGVIVLANLESERLFGYSRDELIGASVDMLVPEPHRASHPQRRAGFFAHPEIRGMAVGRDVVGLRKDGREVPVELKLAPLVTANETLILSVVSDVTERKQAEHELRELNRTLEARVRERTAEAEERARELSWANTALVRSNQELDDFAYIASHDLKEPLRGIANYVRFFEEDHGEQFDEDAHGKLETVSGLCRRLEALIDSLLYFSRVGRVELAIGDADLNPLLAEVLEVLTPSLAEWGVEVRTPGRLPTVRCDRVRVREVFYNLVSNAGKYNDKPHKWVEIGVVATDGNGNGEGNGAGAGAEPPVFYVRDNGIGVRERHHGSMFQIFKRLHGRDKFGGGTGAGLTIVKKIVERHGGQIWIESTCGEGATFYFTLGGAEIDARCEVQASDLVG